MSEKGGLEELLEFFLSVAISVSSRSIFFQGGVEQCFEFGDTFVFGIHDALRILVFPDGQKTNLAVQWKKP